MKTIELLTCQGHRIVPGNNVSGIEKRQRLLSGPAPVEHQQITLGSYPASRDFDRPFECRTGWLQKSRLGLKTKLVGFGNHSGMSYVYPCWPGNIRWNNRTYKLYQSWILFLQKPLDACSNPTPRSWCFLPRFWSVWFEYVSSNKGQTLPKFQVVISTSKSPMRTDHNPSTKQ